MKKSELAQLKVNRKSCKTCPFVGASLLDIGTSTSQRFYKNMLNLKKPYLCHTTGNKTFCRGARDIQIKCLTIMGVLDKPTDKSFKKYMENELNEKSK